MTDGLDFTGQVVVITGAGRGIGRGYALDLGRRGAQVVVNDLGVTRSGEDPDPGVAERVAGEIRAAGGQAVADVNDAATPDGGRAIIDTALTTWGRIDALISNAGAVRDVSFAEQEGADLEAVLAANMLTAFYVGQPAFRAMRDQGTGGRILLTSSASGLLGNIGQSNYGSAKMAMVSLTRTLGWEGAQYNILCNAVAPFARTRLTRRGENLGRRTDDAPPEDPMSPLNLAPLAAVLCHPSCPSTGEIFLAGARLFSRVSIQFHEGYVLKAGETAEDLLRNWDAVRTGPSRELAAGTPRMWTFALERLGVETL